MKNVIEMMKLEFCLVEDGPINTIKTLSSNLLENLKTKSPDFDSKLTELKINYK